MKVTIVLDAEHLVAPRFLNGSGDASHFLLCRLQVNAGGAHRLGARSGFCGVATDVTRTHVSCGGQRRRWGHFLVLAWTVAFHGRTKERLRVPVAARTIGHDDGGDIDD